MCTRQHGVETTARNMGEGRRARGNPDYSWIFFLFSFQTWERSPLSHQFHLRLLITPKFGRTCGICHRGLKTQMLLLNLKARLCVSVSAWVCSEDHSCRPGWRGAAAVSGASSQWGGLIVNLLLRHTKSCSALKGPTSRTQSLGLYILYDVLSLNLNVSKVFFSFTHP